MNLTHRHVEIFRAIMEAHNMTAAAAMIGSSQPTLSKELAELEEVLSLKLFLRLGRRLQPTASALQLYNEVQRSYIGLSRIFAAANQIGKFEQGQLSIIGVPGLIHALMPNVFKRFQECHHSVGLAFVSQEPPLLEDWLSNQRYDLGIIEGERVPPGTQLKALFSFREVCVLPKGHRLLAKSVLAPSDFAGEEFLSLSPLDPIRTEIDGVFRKHGVARNLLFEGDDAMTICRMVQEGLGVSIVNGMTALSVEHLELRPFTEIITYTVSVVRPEFRPFSPLVEQFVQAICLRIEALSKHSIPGLVQITTPEALPGNT